ncbi:uncharacterized protein [Venturia canescens]|uniref:uncharacterized protein n=1 Tax=Venturia canescens TaxID=32260 RepID=UPI001C9BED73|nr:uncharacterized protein LOC122410744 [Venturia canescens]
MGVPDVEQAKRRLQDILTRARQLEIPSDEVISMRASQKLLARTENALAWTIIVGAFVIVLSFVVYARWPTQEVETVRTVLRRTTIAFNNYRILLMEMRKEFRCIFNSPNFEVKAHTYRLETEDRKIAS